LSGRRLAALARACQPAEMPDKPAVDAGEADADRRHAEKVARREMLAQHQRTEEDAGDRDQEVTSIRLTEPAVARIR
jgi:hypothetical protein